MSSHGGQARLVRTTLFASGEDRVKAGSGDDTRLYSTLPITIPARPIPAHPSDPLIPSTCSPRDPTHSASLIRASPNIAADPGIV